MTMNSCFNLRAYYSTRLLLVALVMASSLLFFTGCATPTSNHDSSYGKPVNTAGNNPLYMTIRKDKDGHYYVSQVSAKKGDIRLNDLSPTFNIQKTECGVYIGNKPSQSSMVNRPECSGENEYLFRKIGVNKGSTAGIAVGTLGLALLMGFHDRYTYFDAETFNLAVNEALRNSHIEREAFLAEYDKYIDLYAKRFSQLREQYVNVYQENMKLITFVPRVMDKTGFYNNELESTAPKYVRLVGNAIKAIPVEFTGTPEELRTMYAEAGSRLSDYENILISTTSTYKVDAKKSVTEKGYKLSIAAPEKVPNIGKEQHISVDVVVDAKNFGNVYPSFEASDTNISLLFNGREITLDNNTKNYVKIMSLSVYYNDLIDSKQYEGNSAIELPPNSALRNPIYINTLISNDIRSIAETNGITADDAKKKNIKFGFAVKYRVVEQNVDKTLYITKQYNLYNVLVSQR